MGFSPGSAEPQAEALQALYKAERGKQHVMMHGRLGETLSFHGLSASRGRVCQHLCQPLTASHDAGLEPPWDPLLGDTRAYPEAAQGTS